MVVLSFCITIKNRFAQIQKTLLQNLKDNWDTKEEVNFILVDFGSTDRLRPWLKKHFTKYLECGFLKYFYTNELPYWHASIAKNTSHILADGIIVTNLDCDNYTGHLGGEFVIEKFLNQKYPIVLHQFSKHYHDGSFGRISVRKQDFIHIGGYNEEFQPIGFEDEDLINRLTAYGLKNVQDSTPKYNQALKNTKEESILLCNSTLDWTSMNEMNAVTSFYNIQQNRIIANHDSIGITKNIYDINGNLFSLHSIAQF